MQKYTIRLAAAAFTFLLGWSVYTGYRYVGSLLIPVSAEIPASAAAFATDSIAAAELQIEPLYEEAELNLTGEYYIFEETLPKGLHDFDYLEIVTHDYDPDVTELWIPVPAKGFLQAKRNHKFVSVSVSSDFITFETESKSGINYRFIGKYYPYENGEVSNTIRGTLTKIENGRVNAEMDVTFIPGGC